MVKLRFLDDESDSSPQQEIPITNTDTGPVVPGSAPNKPKLRFLEEEDDGTAVGRIASQVGEGIAEPFTRDDPIGLNPETYQQFQEMGWFRDPDRPGMGDPIRAFNEVLIQSTAAAGESLLRGLESVGGGIQGGVQQTAEEFGVSQGQAKRAGRDARSAFDMGLLVTGNVPAPAITRVGQTVKGRFKNDLREQVKQIGRGDVEDAATATEKPKVPLTPADKKLAPEEPAGPPTMEEMIPGFDGFASTVSKNGQADNLYEGVQRANIAAEDADNFVELLKSDARVAAQERPDFTRSPTTWAENEELAQALGMNPKDLVNRVIGKAFNAEELRAGRRLVNNSSTNTYRLMTEYLQTRDPAVKAAFEEQVRETFLLLNQFRGVKAEAGRALVNLKDTKLNRNAKSLEDLVLRNADMTTDDLIKRLSALDGPEKVSGFLGKVMNAGNKAGDMAYELWINSLLSGPVTHMVNMTSNGLVAAWQIPESVIGATVSKATGSKAITYGEATERLYGLVEGAKDGIRAGHRAWQTEQASDFYSKLEDHTKHIPGITGRVARTPSRALMAEDEFFKAINFRAQINALAYRKAKSKGLKGVRFREEVARLKNNPSQDMTLSAKQFAREQTFTNDLGEVGNAILHVRERIPLKAGKVALPFLRTPINIINYAGKRSPLAVLYKESRDNLAGRNGSVARDQQIARMIMGSTVGVAVTALASEGYITGAGPKDFRKRASWYKAGYQPYSIRVGDSWYSYGRLEPLGLLMGVSADYAELRSAMSDEETDNIGALIMGSVANNLINKTWLRGPAELIQAIQDPERYGDRYVNTLLSTVVPTGLAQIARTNDPYLREARTILDSIKSRVPGQRETLPFIRDLYGQPIKKEQYGKGLDYFMPIFRSTMKDDPAIQEIQRLNLPVGKVNNTIRGVELDAEQTDQYRRVAGGYMEQFLQTVVSAPGYHQLNDDQRKEAIRTGMNKARDIAQRVMVANDPVLARGVAERIAKRKMTRRAVRDALRRQ